MNVNKIGIRIASLAIGIIYLLLVYLAFKIDRRFFMLGFMGIIFIVFSFSIGKEKMLIVGLILLIISNYSLAVSNFSEIIIGNLKLGKTFNLLMETIPWITLLIFLFLIVFESNNNTREKLKKGN